MIYGYIRTAAKTESVNEQRKLLEPLKPNAIYEDVNVTGRTSLFLRPQGAELSKALVQGDTLVIARASVAFNSVGDFAHALNDLLLDDVQLIVLSISSEPLTSADADVLVEAATIDSYMKRERANSSIEKYGYRGGRTPFGFKRDKDKKLTEHPWFAEALQLIRTSPEPLRGLQSKIQARYGESPSLMTLSKLRRGV